MVMSRGHAKNLITTICDLTYLSANVKSKSGCQKDLHIEFLLECEKRLLFMILRVYFKKQQTIDFLLF